MSESSDFRSRFIERAKAVSPQRATVSLALLCVALSLFWPMRSQARSIDSVSLTPSVAAQADGENFGGAPGELVPAAFTIRNQGASLSITGELDFTAPLLKTSVIRGWWIAVERRTGSGSWTPVAGSSASADGHTFAVAPPATSGMSIQASPKPALGVTYPSTGDRVVGTQILGLFRANWDFGSEIALNADATSELMAAANSGDVRLRWRLESRNTGLFGILTTGSHSHSAPFSLMLKSQSPTASNVTVSVSGDDRTQLFSPANTPGLSTIPVGASVPIAATAQIPSISARASDETVDDYLDRLAAATNQPVSLTSATSFTASGPALAYWWWPWDTDSPFDVSGDRTILAPNASNSADVLVPIIELSKTGPASVNSGSTADYEITARNVGNTAGTVSVLDAVDGYVPQPVPGYGSLTGGASVTQVYSHPVSITTPSGSLGNTASATWSDLAGNNYGPVDDSVTSEVIGDEDPPPPPTLTQAPQAFSNSSTASFEFVGEPGGGFECSMGAGAMSSCASPFNTGPLADGQHQFSVSQRDAAGNLGSATTYLWTVDTAAPDPVVITDAPTGVVASSDATVSFTSEPQAETECQINASAWTSCESPANFSALPDDEIQLSVRQTDLAGNTSATAQTSWTVDTTAPISPEFIATPPSESTSSEAAFEFSVESGSAAQCSFDGSEFATCASPVTFNSLEEGAHTFSVRAVDAAGNIGSASAYAWNITFENNQCRPEVTESAPLELPDDAGMEDDGGGE